MRSTIRSLAAALVTSLIACTGADAAFPGQNGKIAFQRGGADPEIYTVEPDGTAATRLTSNSTFDGQPVWSPSGSKIAFWGSGAGDTSDIYVMNQDGTGLTNVTNTADRGELEPAWSPDGTKIAFTASTTGGVHIFVMNADGSGATQITTAAGFNAQPAWSPDGTKIAYVTNPGYPEGDFDILHDEPERGRYHSADERSDRRPESRLVARRHQDRLSPRPGAVRQHCRHLGDECRRHRSDRAHV